MGSSTRAASVGSLSVESSGLALPSSGDLGAQVKGDTLFVALQADWFERHQVRTAEALVVFMHTFPTSLATELGWSLDEVRAARAGLVEVLRPYLPEDILFPPPPRPRGYGARR